MRSPRRTAFQARKPAFVDFGDAREPTNVLSVLLGDSFQVLNVMRK